MEPWRASDKPATPRERVPGARCVVGEVALIKGDANCCGDASYCGKAVTTFALAAIADLQADSSARGDVPGVLSADGWQSFGDLVAGDAAGARRLPVTVTPGVKTALAALFLGVADLARGGDMSAPWREANIVRLMRAVGARARHLLRLPTLSRMLDFPQVFRQRFGARGVPESLTTLCAQLFLNFVKIIAWHAAVRAYEQRERFTLNLGAFFGLLASMEASLSEDEAPVVRDVLNLVRAQTDAWEFAQATTKVKKEMLAPKKLAPPVAAPPALPVAAPPALPVEAPPALPGAIEFSFEDLFDMF